MACNSAFKIILTPQYPGNPVHQSPMEFLMMPPTPDRPGLPREMM